MRILCALFVLFACAKLPAQTTQQGRMIGGKGYTGVILTPAMFKASSTWKQLDSETKKNFAFWTPSSYEIAQAEKALSLRLEQDRADSQPRGFLFRNYYSPKYYSRDRLTRSEEDPIYYGWVRGLQSPHIRQYIGVTYWGDRWLVMTFLDDPPAPSFKNSWMDHDPRISYLSASNRFDGAGFVVLEDQ